MPAFGGLTVAEIPYRVRQRGNYRQEDRRIYFGYVASAVIAYGFGNGDRRRGAKVRKTVMDGLGQPTDELPGNGELLAAWSGR